VNATGRRLLAYARVSDVRGREGPGFSSEADQHQRCRSYADAHGDRILEEASDLDVSGGVMSRPTFDRFLEMVVEGKADGIIVAKLDRFARRTRSRSSAPRAPVRAAALRLVKGSNGTPDTPAL
jgi:DNA invertase Pin-like site-specific DNA recombinase